MPVAEALDRALEILRTTELYSPQLGTKDEDPHTSDLVGGLMTVSTYCHRWLLINVSLPDFPSWSIFIIWHVLYLYNANFQEKLHTSFFGFLPTKQKL